MVELAEAISCLFQTADTLTPEEASRTQQKVEEIIRKYTIEHYQPEFPIAIYKFYDHLLRGGSSLQLSLGSLERRTEFESNRARFLHAHLLLSRGNVQEASERSRIPEEKFRELLEREHLYPDEYKQLPWPRELNFGDITNYLVLKEGTLPSKESAREEYVKTYLWHAYNSGELRSNGKVNKSRLARSLGLSRFGLDKLLKRTGTLAPEGASFKRNPNYQGPAPTWKDAQQQFNKLYTERVLEACEGNSTRAAKVAGMSRYGFQKNKIAAGIPLTRRE